MCSSSTIYDDYYFNMRVQGYMFLFQFDLIETSCIYIKNCETLLILEFYAIVDLLYQIETFFGRRMDF